MNRLQSLSKEISTAKRRPPTVRPAGLLGRVVARLKARRPSPAPTESGPSAPSVLFR